MSVKHRHRGHFSELEIGENKAELTLPQVLHQNPFKKFMDLSLNNLRYGYLHYQVLDACVVMFAHSNRILSYRESLSRTKKRKPQQIQVKATSHKASWIIKCETKNTIPSVQFKNTIPSVQFKNQLRKLYKQNQNRHPDTNIHINVSTPLTLKYT